MISATVADLSSRDPTRAAVSEWEVKVSRKLAHPVRTARVRIQPERRIGIGGKRFGVRVLLMVFQYLVQCPHQGGSLSDGLVEGDIVTCPLHGWEFDLRSGACMTIPGESVPRYSVTVEDGAIFLEDAS